ncbi:MAG: PHP domain-containing protein [Lentisphaeria bacterium]|nr:PHP domain-containing protein [Lentisphaeria bacterium]
MLVDLHVHSALSACAENIMSPRRIVRQAVEKGVKVLALTDHNASGHVSAARRLGGQLGVTVFPAMEVTSREDAHLLAFFPDEESLFSFQALVDAHLPDFAGLPAGDQVLYDERDEIIDIDTKPRQFGLDLGVTRLVEEIHQRGGRAVPSHIHRPRFSLTSQLGFIPPDSGFDAVELDWREWRRDHWRVGGRCDGYPVITGSDAHVLNDVGAHAMSVPENDRDVSRFFDHL